MTTFGSTAMHLFLLKIFLQNSLGELFDSIFHLLTIERSKLVTCKVEILVRSFIFIGYGLLLFFIRYKLGDFIAVYSY